MHSKLRVPVRNYARLAVVAATVLGSAGLLSGVAFGSTAGATAPAARAKVHHESGLRRREPSAGAAEPVRQQKLGRPEPAVSATPKIPVATANSTTFTVNTTNDAPLATTGSKTCKASTATGLCTLRAAIKGRQQRPTVTSTSSMSRPVPTSSQRTWTLTNSAIINGAGSASTFVDGQTSHEVLDIYSATTTFEPSVDVTGLTVENGSNIVGGGIYLGHAALTLSGVTVSNSGALAGGGIFVTGGALWTDNSTVITSNTAEDGGGLYNTEGAVYLGGSTLSNNTAYFGGAADSTSGAQVSQNVTLATATRPLRAAVPLYNAGTLSDSGSTYTNISTTGQTRTTTYGGVIDNVWNASLIGDTVTGTTSHEATLGTTLHGGVFFNSGQMTIDSTTVSGTSNSCNHCDILGGVIFSGTKHRRSGTRGRVVPHRHRAHTVTGTTNGTAAGDPRGGRRRRPQHREPHHTGRPQRLEHDRYDHNKRGLRCRHRSDNMDSKSADLRSAAPPSPSRTSAVQSGTVALTSTALITGLSISRTTVTATTGGEVFGCRDCGWNNQHARPRHRVQHVDLHRDRVCGRRRNGHRRDHQHHGQLRVGTPTIHLGGTSPTGGVEGGGWANTGSLTLNGVQVIGTSITTTHNVYGGAFGNAGTGAATITNSTFAGTSVTETGVGNVWRRRGRKLQQPVGPSPT